MPDQIKAAIQEIKNYPSAIFGICIILSLFSLAVYSVIAIPYQDAITLWRADVGIWDRTPRNARPAWFNWVPGVNLPQNISSSSQSPQAKKEITDLGNGMSRIVIELPFRFDYDGFPKEITLFFDAEYTETRPWVSLVWHTPDGREIDIVEQSIREQERLRISQMEDLRENLFGYRPLIGLFMKPESEPPDVKKGEYKLTVDGLVFEEDAQLDVDIVVYGQLYGAAGTDHRRRSLAVALMWGTPIALAFAFLAAVGSTLTTMFIAAVGVWFGGIIDATIQRITEVNMILPALPIMIMVGILYSRSIWVMLAIIIILGIFSAGIKTYRAVFLQVKEAPYIEAARAYGAGNLRILIKYMIPKVLPMLVPQFVVLIPSFVFLEATLAILGLGDPLLPTWGKVLNDAHQQDALLSGQYYWVLLPAFLLITTGFGFAMVGFALDRIFNPRLKSY